MSVWLAETLIATTLLMALVMMVRQPVARWLGAGAAYMLWALPLARMVLPALPDDMADPSPLHVVMDHSGLPAMLTADPAPAIDATPGLPWTELAIALWLVGMAGFMLLQIIGYLRFRNLMLKDAVSVAAEGLVSTILGFLALVLATINVVAGFLVTHRMVGMFKKKS